MNAYRLIGASLVLVASGLASALGCAETHDPRTRLESDRGGAGEAAEDDGRSTSSDRGAAAGGDESEVAGTSADAQGTEPKFPRADEHTNTDSGSAAEPTNDRLGPSNTATDVWIGELWSISSVLCDPNENWMPSALSSNGYVERAVLILEHGADVAVRGVIRFGEGEPPGEGPGNAPYDMHDTKFFWLCSIQLPTKGIEYSLRSIELSADRLRFEIAAGETWNAWCSTQHEPCPGSPDGTCLHANLTPDEGQSDSICECEGDRCTGAADQKHVAFDLRVTADTIEGQLPFGGGFGGTPAQLRLQRVQP